MANNKYPNAYAVGAHSVVVTTGLLGMGTSNEELDGLLAHEIGHIMHGDTIKRTVAYTLNTAGNIASLVLVAVLTLIGFLGEIVGRTGFIALIVGGIALVFKLALRLVQYLLDLGMLAVGRLEEYRADAYAKSLGFGPGLVSFLNRMQYIEKAPQGLWAALSRTHPPTAERIRRLTEEHLSEQRTEAPPTEMGGNGAVVSLNPINAVRPSYTRSEVKRIVGISKEKVPRGDSG